MADEVKEVVPEVPDPSKPIPVTPLSYGSHEMKESPLFKNSIRDPKTLKP